MKLASLFIATFIVAYVRSTNPPTDAPSMAPSAAPTLPTDAPSNAPSAAPTLPTDAPSAAPTFPTDAPSMAPSAAPTLPTDAPSTAPSAAPSMAPSGAPTSPSNAPSNAPSAAPSMAPSAAPTPPTDAPSMAPSSAPTPPTAAPSNAPSSAPTSPTNAPSMAPSRTPSDAPSMAPSAAPTLPTDAPSMAPSAAPSMAPSSAPTPPTAAPSSAPTLPTAAPSNAPSGEPTQPTTAPSSAPSSAPTSPTNAPSLAPSDAPSMAPSAAPTAPTNAPSSAPTSPTNAPSRSPSAAPSNAPSSAPTMPTNAPSSAPTSPTAAPSNAPSSAPTFPTDAPSAAPTSPTASPSTAPTGEPSQPTNAPSDSPSSAPTPPTDAPSMAPSSAPSNAPSSAPTSPTNAPSSAPTAPTSAPSGAPTPPSAAPSLAPSRSPSSAPTPPTNAPSSAPSSAPTPPTDAPSLAPSNAPVANPTSAPTAPTASPSVAPTNTPSQPTSAPTAAPTLPTDAPSLAPSSAPTPPTAAPSNAPSSAPTPPTGAPSTSPSSAPSPAPVQAPSLAPSGTPTSAPTSPTEAPSSAPTPRPTSSPTYNPTEPTQSPTNYPTYGGVTSDLGTCKGISQTGAMYRTAVAADFCYDDGRQFLCENGTSISQNRYGNGKCWGNATDTYAINDGYSDEGFVFNTNCDAEAIDDCHAYGIMYSSYNSTNCTNNGQNGAYKNVFVLGFCYGFKELYSFKLQCNSNNTINRTEVIWYEGGHCNSTYQLFNGYADTCINVNTSNNITIAFNFEALDSVCGETMSPTEAPTFMPSLMPSREPTNMPTLYPTYDSNTDLGTCKAVATEDASSRWAISIHQDICNNGTLMQCDSNGVAIGTTYDSSDCTGSIIETENVTDTVVYGTVIEVNCGPSLTDCHATGTMYENTADSSNCNKNSMDVSSTSENFVIGYCYGDGDSRSFMLSCENSGARATYVQYYDDGDCTSAIGSSVQATTCTDVNGNAMWFDFSDTICNDTLMPTTEPTDQPTFQPTSEPTNYPTYGNVDGDLNTCKGLAIESAERRSAYASDQCYDGNKFSCINDTHMEFNWYANARCNGESSYNEIFTNGQQQADLYVLNCDSNVNIDDCHVTAKMYVASDDENVTCADFNDDNNEDIGGESSSFVTGYCYGFMEILSYELSCNSNTETTEVTFYSGGHCSNDTSPLSFGAASDCHIMNITSSMFNTTLYAQFQVYDSVCGETRTPTAAPTMYPTFNGENPLGQCAGIAIENGEYRQAMPIGGDNITWNGCNGDSYVECLDDGNTIKVTPYINGECLTGTINQSAVWNISSWSAYGTNLWVNCGENTKDCTVRSDDYTYYNQSNTECDSSIGWYDNSTDNSYVLDYCYGYKNYYSMKYSCQGGGSNVTLISYYTGGRCDENNLINTITSDECLNATPIQALNSTIFNMGSIQSTIVESMCTQSTDAPTSSPTTLSPTSYPTWRPKAILNNCQAIATESSSQREAYTPGYCYGTEKWVCLSSTSAKKTEYSGAGCSGTVEDTKTVSNGLNADGQLWTVACSDSYDDCVSVGVSNMYETSSCSGSAISEMTHYNAYVNDYCYGQVSGDVVYSYKLKCDSNKVVVDFWNNNAKCEGNAGVSANAQECNSIIVGGTTYGAQFTFSDSVCFAEDDAYTNKNNINIVTIFILSIISTVVVTIYEF